MELFINNHGSKPIYEQISDQIKALIIGGELQAGEALPSIRSMARSLHISVLTVQKAYDKLFSKQKDELLEDYGIIKCGDEQFKALDREDWITCRRQDYEWQVLTSDRKKAEKKYPKAMITPATIDEIMLLYVKGEQG